MPNPELQIKSLEKRLSAAEKKLDQYDKQLRQVDYKALVKKLETQDKAIAMLVMSIKDPKKHMSKLLTEDDGAKLAVAIAQREAQKTIKQVMIDVNKMNIENRFKALEAMVRALSTR